MVVAYKVNWLTYQVARRMIRVPFVSLPNLLAGRKIVTECLQKDCRPEIMGNEIITLLNDKKRVQKLINEFIALHRKLSTGPNQYC